MGDYTKISSLNVSLNSSEDLARSIDSLRSSNASLTSNGRLSNGTGSADLGISSLRGSLRSHRDFDDYNSWLVSIDNNTWPRRGRSAKSSLLSSQTRFCNKGSNCVLHAGHEGAEPCPFDSSKYQKKSLIFSRSSGSLDSSIGRLYSSSSKEISPISSTNKMFHDYLNGTDPVMSNGHGSLEKDGFENHPDEAKSALNLDKLGPDYNVDAEKVEIVKETSLNGDLWSPKSSFKPLDVSAVGRLSSCKVNAGINRSRSNVSSSYNKNTSFERGKFRNRLTAANFGSSKSVNGKFTGDKSASLFRQELEWQYSLYRESYLNPTMSR